MKYAAVIAAAGISSRMHEFKPMMYLNDGTVISSVIGNLRAAGAEEIVVVTGYKAEILEKHVLPLGVRVRRNDAYTETKMFESLCMGIRALSEPYDYVLLTPGDVPLVMPETIERMKSLGEDIVRPMCSGKPGHPILISRKYVADILAYGGENGLGGALNTLGLPVYDLNVDDRGTILDADTPEDFRALRREASERRSGGRLWPDIKIHISKGDAILTPEMAQFLEMIDHTGSIQNACGCMHISYSNGWKRLNAMEQELGYPLIERYPGGNYGGGSRLTEKGRRLLKAYQEFGEELRGMAEELFKSKFPDDLHN